MQREADEGERVRHRVEIRERFDDHHLHVLRQQRVVDLVEVAARRGHVHADQAQLARGEVLRGFDGHRGVIFKKTRRAVLAMPAGVDDHPRGRAQKRLVLEKILRGDRLARLLGNLDHSRRTVKPRQRHLVDPLSVHDEVPHRIDVRALVRTHADAAEIAARALHREVRIDAQLRVAGEAGEPIAQRMGEVDKAHVGRARCRLPRRGVESLS